MQLTENKILPVPEKISLPILSDFKKALEKLLAQNPGKISLDCTALEQVTSSHVNAIWLAYLMCSEKSIKVHLISPTPGLIRVLKMLELQEFFVYERRNRYKAAESPIITDDFSGTYIDEFPCQLEKCRHALDGFLEYLKGLSLPLITIFEIQTIFYEMTSNISTHSKANEDELIVFTARIKDNTLTMVFIDSGVAFNVVMSDKEFDPSTASKEHKTRGFGLVMLHKLADKISYVRENNNLNVVIIEKKWS